MVINHFQMLMWTPSLASEIYRVTPRPATPSRHLIEQGEAGLTVGGP